MMIRLNTDPKSVGHPASGSRPSIQAVPGMGCLLRCRSLVRSVIGRPLPLVLRTQAHLADRTGCRWKVLWLGQCSSPTTGSLALFQKMHDSGSVTPISRYLCQGHPPDSFYCTKFLHCAIPNAPNQRHLSCTISILRGSLLFPYSQSTLNIYFSF